MRKLIFGRSSIVVAVSVMILIGASVVLAGPPVNRVSGGGSTDSFGMPMESYGFTAKIDAEGNVKGQGVWQFRPQDATFHGEFNCLHVNGNEAWLGGMLTKVKVDGPFPENVEFIWHVQDNGEGADAPPDRISTLLLSLTPGFSSTCVDEPEIPMGLLPLDNGNIQVD